MEVILLTNDGRCKWLESQVMRKLLPEVIKSSRNPKNPKKYVIVDWISNDNGKVGVDLKWFNRLGVPAVATYNDLPEGNNFSVITTGYDSIVHEENLLKERNVQIIDKPCPFVRKIRTQFETADNNYQYVLLCESNHIIIKNFASLFPKDMILVQMNNYKELITNGQNGKPLKFISYVTFLKRQSHEIYNFINTNYPERENLIIDSQCMWADSKVSPLNEINELTDEKLKGVKTACLIGTSGSINKSVISLVETIENRGLNVKYVSSLKEFIQFKQAHKKDKVLIVKSPIPNDAEEPIMIYLKHGLLKAYLSQFLAQSQIKIRLYGIINKTIFYKNSFLLLFKPQLEI